MNIEQRKCLSQYLRTQLESVEKEIAELEAPVDPYAELKAAYAAGKRIAYLKKIGEIKAFDKWVLVDNPKICLWEAIPPDFYKIVEDDLTYKATYYVLGQINEEITTKYTKCALTGKISAEVVNE